MTPTGEALGHGFSSLTGNYSIERLKTMANRYFSLLLFLLLALPALKLQAKTLTLPPSFFEKTDAFLKKHVREGMVDYAAAARDQEALKGLLQMVGTADQKGASASEKKAFFINAYNLLVVGAVLERYPLPSVKEVPGFFDKRTFAVAGERLTLNDLENKKLREPYQDPRIHFVLVCAAKGCPPLRAGAFLPASVDQQLTEQTRLALNDPAFVRVNQNKKQVQVSEIFKWYAADFPAGSQGLISFLNTYRSAPVKENFSIGHYSYDWTLNDVRGRK